MKLFDATIENKTKNLTKQNYQEANGFIIAFSLANTDSFVRARGLIQKVIDVKGEDVPMILVGTQMEVEEKKVGIDQPKMLANDYDMKYMEVSAKTGKGIEEMMEEIQGLVFKQKIIPEIKAVSERVSTRSVEGPPKSPNL